MLNDIIWKITFLFSRGVFDGATYLMMYFKYNIAYNVFTNIYKINIYYIIMLLLVFLQVETIQWKIWKPFVLVSMEVIFGHIIA